VPDRTRVGSGIGRRDCVHTSTLRIGRRPGWGLLIGDPLRPASPRLRPPIGFSSMAGQMGVIVTLDGEIHPPGTALLHADDLAAVRGDGIFETLLVRDGMACLVESHLQRLTQSAKFMDLPEPDLASWRHAIDLATRRWAQGTADEGAMRLICSRGRESGSPPTGYVMVNPVPERVAAGRRGGLTAGAPGHGGAPPRGAPEAPLLAAARPTL